MNRFILVLSIILLSELPFVALAREQHAVLDIGKGAIKGNASVADFRGWIGINTFSYAIQQNGRWDRNTDRPSPSQPYFGEVTLTKTIDPASPGLALAAAKGNAFSGATIALLHEGRAYARIILEKVYVSSVAVQAQAVQAQETITLRYGKATWRFGTEQGCFDLARRSKCR